MLTFFVGGYGGLLLLLPLAEFLYHSLEHRSLQLHIASLLPAAGDDSADADAALLTSDFGLSRILRIAGAVACLTALSSAVRRLCRQSRQPSFAQAAEATAPDRWRAPLAAAVALLVLWLWLETVQGFLLQSVVLSFGARLALALGAALTLCAALVLRAWLQRRSIYAGALLAMASLLWVTNGSDLELDDVLFGPAMVGLVEGCGRLVLSSARVEALIVAPATAALQRFVFPQVGGMSSI